MRGRRGGPENPIEDVGAMPVFVQKPNSSSWAEVGNRVEAFAGAFIGSFIAVLLGVGTAQFLNAVWEGPIWQTIAAGLLFGWCLVTEFWFLCTTWDVVLHEPAPCAVAIALRQPTLPVPVRPVMAIWWGFHSLLALTFGISIIMIGFLFGPQMPIGVVLLLGLITSAFAGVTFDYVLLAVTAFTREPAFVQKLWCWRGRWALAHGIVVLAAQVVAALL
jgi:hypothetical protein